MTKRYPGAWDRILTGRVVGPLAIVAALTALVAAPAAVAKTDPPGPCNQVLERADADAILGGLTPGFIDSDTEPPSLHKWPKREDRLCTWQGKFGTLILKIYKWTEASQRQEFAKTLCSSGSAGLCAHARSVRESDDAADAIEALAGALNRDGRDVGPVRRIPGVTHGFWLDPANGNLGSNAWGPRGERYVLEFTCFANDPGDRERRQNKCAVNAMQRADLNY